VSNENKIVNEFVIRFANVNGSGSLSANGLFTKAVFRAGVPVGCKNIYPSNIEGLPTWYEIRVSESGHIGSRGKYADIVVSNNQETVTEDIANVTKGGSFIYDNVLTIADEIKRDDIKFISIPFTVMAKENFDNPKSRSLMKNVIYIGALAALTGLDLDILKGVVEDDFKGKASVIDENKKALDLGYNYARSVFGYLDFAIEKRDLNKDKILFNGNDALALGAIYGGATLLAWYPITPATSCADSFKVYAEKYRIDNETGKKNYAILQVEDEIASIGAVVGASWNGARAFTATSGPGISLMTEILGLAYFAEIPCVIFNVQRGGPSTGMPTRTQQSDLISCAYASHGDTKNILLIPSTPTECFEMAADAFDIADQLQNPVILMSDLDVGVNDVACDKLTWDSERKYNRGKVLLEADLEVMVDDFGRYKDIDGDGIPYRTYPAMHKDKGCFFTRGTSHDEYARYSETSEDYKLIMDRLKLKWNSAKKYVQAPVIERQHDMFDVGVIYYGSSKFPTEEALDILESESIYVDAMRIRSVPFNDEVVDFISKHKKVIIIEQNRDAQMKTLLVNELEVNPQKLRSVLVYGGAPITAREIYSQIKEIL